MMGIRARCPPTRTRAQRRCWPRQRGLHATQQPTRGATRGIAEEEALLAEEYRHNRRLRTELATKIHSSRQRVGMLHSDRFDKAALTPSSARASLKEGVRTPLELVRSELRQRHPHRLPLATQARGDATPRETTPGQLPGRTPSSAETAAAAQAATPAGAAELPSMA